jgi:hypothetical protein
VWAPRTGPRGCLGLHPRTHDTRGGTPFASRPFPRGCAPLLVRVLYLLQLEFCFASSFSYLEHAQIRVVLCDSELHLRVILRLLASDSCSFFDCAQELIFVIRLILCRQDL